MRIICLGDSFTEGYLVEDKSYTRFLSKAGFDIVNLGKNGSTSADMLERYRKFVAKSKDSELLIVFGGTNDFMLGFSVDFVFKKLKSIVELKESAKVLVIAPPFVEEDEFYPIYGEINVKIAHLKEKIKTMGVDFIDAEEISGHYLDGVHFASDFHKNLAEKIIEKIGE